MSEHGARCPWCARKYLGDNCFLCGGSGWVSSYDAPFIRLKVKQVNIDWNIKMDQIEGEVRREKRKEKDGI